MRKPTRREAIRSVGSAALTLALAGNTKGKSCEIGGVVKLGVIADLHGGLAVDAEHRLNEFLRSMKSAKVDALVQLGDFAFPNAKHQRFADRLNNASDSVIHVIGNHEFDYGLKRNDCFKAWGISSAYYIRDVGGLRILVLDGNEKGSPTHKGGYPSYVGKTQIQWMVEQLEAADRPVLILSHQPLAGVAAINNSREVQQVLSKYKDKIALCANGHSHVDSLLQVDGVNYLHINSASYYWVGGKKRMSYYQDPLFTTLTFDFDRKHVGVDASSSEWKPGDSPRIHKYFERAAAPPETIVSPQIRGRLISIGDQRGSLLLSNRIKTSPDTLKVMTWNIWGRLNQDPRYTIKNRTARDRVIEIIKRSDADIIAMIETYGSAQDIADALGFEHYTQAPNANLCIFSRFPLSDTGALKGLSPFSFIAATVTLPRGQKVRIYDIWLTSGGRHIVEIKNEDVSDKDFCDGDDIRCDMLEKFLKHDDMQKHLKNADNVPVIVAGDFNCVSHLDYSVVTRQSNLNQRRVLPIKASKSMHAAGFNDTYRYANPDINESTLGYTWTTVGMGFVYKDGEGFVPVEKNPEPQFRDPYARIDRIYATGSNIGIIQSKVITHHHDHAHRSFPEFPSDHAAVMTEFAIPKERKN